MLALDILSCLKLEVCVSAPYKNGQVAQDFASNSTIPLVETKLTLYYDSDDSRHLETLNATCYSFLLFVSLQYSDTYVM